MLTVGEERAALRQYYTRQPPPPCSVCGAPLGVGELSPERTVWYCSTTITSSDPTLTQHFWRSKWVEANRADPRVIGLLDELEAIERRAGLLERLVETYAGHDVHCPAREGRSPCDCGWEQDRAALRVPAQSTTGGMDA